MGTGMQVDGTEARNLGPHPGLRGGSSIHKVARVPFPPGVASNKCKREGLHTEKECWISIIECSGRPLRK